MPSSSPTPGPRKRTYAVSGMTCPSCEMLLESTLRDVPGVTGAAASLRTGTVEICFDGNTPTLKTLNAALADTAYTLSTRTTTTVAAPAPVADAPATSRHWLEALGMLTLVVVAYLVLRQTGLFSLSTTVEISMSLSAVFLVGLVAATSTCLAVVGGLLLSVSAKWADAHGSVTHWQKLRPLLFFNAGRLIGYFLLGGLIGLLGQAITLSPHAQGYLTMILAVVMIVLGLNVLHILPKKYCTIPLPRAFTRRIAGLTNSQSSFAPLLLGGLTFFLPCGFTQSMQLLALASGSFLAGGTIMLVFALGTLPSLLGISLLSSLLEGRMSRAFVLFSGATVLLLGFTNLQSGLVLTGLDTRSILDKLLPGTQQAIGKAVDDPYVSIDPQGRQIVTVYVSDAGYKPDSFTIEAGRETWFYAIAKNGISGCASFLVAPDFNVSVPVRQGTNWLGPIRNPQKDFLITCSMGMLRAGVHVKPS